MKWTWREAKRLQRLLFPEQSVRDLVKCVGPWWLFVHGVKREHKIQLWASEGWYCADFCIPHKKLIVEADGGVHNFTKKRDVVRDFRLNEKGWDVLRIDVRTIKKDPRGVKRKVRRYLRG